MMIAMALGLVVVPFWISAHSPWYIVIGVFLMQFFVQGAWGIVPAHVNELSPNHLRGFFPGFAYQLGVMFAASIPYVESALGERFTYTQAMAVSWRSSSSSPSSWCCSALRRRASVSESTHRGSGLGASCRYPARG